MKKWVSNGVELSLINNLTSINDILTKYADNKAKSIILDNIKYDYKISDGDSLKLITFFDTIKLNLCISIEMNINKFCYFNLGKDIFNAIETLNTEKKMIITSSFIKVTFKGTKTNQLIKEFLAWRNKYAHGKNPFNKNGNFVNEESNIEDEQAESDIELIIDIMKAIIETCRNYMEIEKYLNDNNKYELSIADNEYLKDIANLLLLIEYNCSILKEDVTTKEYISKILDKHQKELEEITKEK
ncbi:hypothetical protein FDB41_10590 [Clostridium botulinum]|nr:hypothetical protein [Clostridium botulinum]NFO53993.1 hypothetical protein [Clostridium botulinum]